MIAQKAFWHKILEMLQKGLKIKTRGANALRIQTQMLPIQFWLVFRSK